MRSNARKGRAEWVREVAAFERAGVTQAEFCERRGLQLGTFRSWLYRLRAERFEREEREPARLVELVPSAAPSPDSACVVRVGTTEVRFAVRPEAEYLGELLRAVEER